MKRFALLSLAAAATLLGETVAPHAPIVVAPDGAARTVKYGEHDIIPVRTMLRYQTIIVLPEGQKILDFLCGDVANWVIQGAVNMAFVHPSKAGASTNLNLVTNQGRVYSFTLQEGGAPADLKVFVQDKSPAVSRVKLFAESDVQAFEKRALAAEMKAKEATERAATQVAQAQAKANEKVDTAAVDLPKQIKSPYRFKKDQPPFNVRNIFHDGRFTYIEAPNSSNVPIIYERIDGKPKVVQFSYENGMFTIPKVVSDGYLAFGKKKMEFYAVR